MRERATPNEERAGAQPPAEGFSVSPRARQAEPRKIKGAVAPTALLEPLQRREGRQGSERSQRAGEGAEQA